MPTWNPPANPSPTGGYNLDLMQMNYSPAMYNYFNQSQYSSAVTNAGQQPQSPALGAYQQHMLNAQQQVNGFGLVFLLNCDYSFTRLIHLTINILVPIRIQTC